MSSNELIGLIQAAGWVLTRTNGSHHHFKHPEKKGLVTVPHPKKDLPMGTVRNIKKQAELL